MAQSKKQINLALQGGGSHGAFTWGVLDRLLEEDKLEIAAVSGTSAGAMNTAVLADGMTQGGRAGAREKLDSFWRAVAQAAVFSPIQRSWLDMFMGNWDLDMSPSYHFFSTMTRFWSPEQLNPLNINPLRDILDNHVDFENVVHCTQMQVFISATNVETGRVRVFNRQEISSDVVMASACLPFLYPAVEIDGVPYWDGGYAGNPPLFPFSTWSSCSDILIVQINPIEREGTPSTAHEIHNRINEITFNQSLLKELRAIDFVKRLLEEGRLDSEQYRDMKVHIIHGAEELKALGASSKMNAEWRFLTHLRDIGRQTADDWLTAHFDDIGERSTIDLRAMFDGILNKLTPLQDNPGHDAVEEADKSKPSPHKTA